MVMLGGHRHIPVPHSSQQLPAPPHSPQQFFGEDLQGCRKLRCGAVQLHLMTKLGFVSLVIVMEVATRVSPVQLLMF